MGISRRPLGAQEECEGIGRNQAGGHVSAGDGGWEGEGWRVTEAMGSRVPGSRSLGGPNWFFVLWGCCLEGLLQRLFLVGPGGWGRLVTGLVQGPHRCPRDRLCSAPEWAEWFLRRRLLRALIVERRPCGDWRRFRQQVGGPLGSASCLRLPSSACASYARCSTLSSDTAACGPSMLRMPQSSFSDCFPLPSS